MEEQTRIVEIGGIKVEVDLRNCKVIENYKVGDQVKVLKKKYSDSYETFPGVIIGFDDFQNLPSILIACLKADYSGQKLNFLLLTTSRQMLRLHHSTNSTSISVSLRLLKN